MCGSECSGRGRRHVIQAKGGLCDQLDSKGYILCIFLSMCVR